MQFAQPLWIVAGLLCCAGLIVLLRTLQARRQAALQRFAAAQLLNRLTRHVSTERRRLKTILLVLAVFLLFCALARPQYGFKWVEVKRKGIDILFAIDTSKSMLAEDIKPNRLQRARLGIMDFVNQLEGDRVGLLPFAGSAYLMCPLTLDYDAFISSLNSVNTDIIPKGGTNIAAVIEEAENVLGNDANHKILILLTDGENLQGEAVAAAERAREKGLTIYTVGVGTSEGELIPLSDGASGFVRDKETGQYITSKLDEQTLNSIATATDGMYVPLGNSGEGLERIYQQKLQLIPKEELAERRHKVPTERFSWPLTLAIVLLCLEFLIPEHRSKHRSSLSARDTVGRWIKRLTAPLLFIAFFAGSTSSDSWAGEAENAYAQQEYLKASELYDKALKERPEDPILQYNYGTAAYKNDMYDEAIASFTESLKSDDLSLQAKAYYNRANALFQKGAESRESNPQATAEQWQRSLESYDAALKLNPDDPLAGENRQYVEQQLKEIEKQLEQQKQERDQQSKQDNSEQENQSDRNESQQQNSSAQQQEGNGQDSSDGSPEKQDEDGNTQAESQTSETGSSEKHDENRMDQEVSPSEQQQNGAIADQQSAKDADLERRELGKMTRAEAENLLNALKNEEGELNFVPRNREPEIGRDW